MDNKCHLVSHVTTDLGLPLLRAAEPFVLAGPGKRSNNSDCGKRNHNRLLLPLETVQHNTCPGLPGFHNPRTGQRRGAFVSFVGAAPSGAQERPLAAGFAPLCVCPYRKVTAGKGRQTSFTRPRRPVQAGYQDRPNASSKSLC